MTGTWLYHMELTANNYVLDCLSSASFYELNSAAFKITLFIVPTDAHYLCTSGWYAAITMTTSMLTSTDKPYW